MIRRVKASAVAAVVFAVFCWSSLPAASAETKLSVRLDWIGYGLHAPFYVALDKGWFKEAGLDVTVEDGNGSAKTVTLVAANEADIGFANLSSMILAKNKGLPVISIGQLVRKCDVGVLVPAESGWKTPKDLEGKRVGLTPGGIVDPFVGTFFTRGGTARDRVQIVNVTASAKASLYMAGNLDAFFTSVPGDLPEIESKRPSHSILFADYGLTLPGFGLFAGPAIMEKNPAAVGAFVRVFFKALDYVYQGHEEEGVASFRKHRPRTAYSPEVVRHQIEAFREFLSSDSTRGKPSGWHSPEDWATTIRLMTEANLLPNKLKPTDYYTNAFVEGRMP